MFSENPKKSYRNNHPEIKHIPALFNNPVLMDSNKQNNYNSLIGIRGLQVAPKML